MTERQAVARIAKKYKAQYCKNKMWDEFHFWDIQPKETYLIMSELKSFAAVEALTNVSWTNWWKRRVSAEKRRKRRAKP